MKYEVQKSLNGFEYYIIDTESRIRTTENECGQKVMATTYEGEIVAGIIADALNANKEKIGGIL